MKGLSSGYSKEIDIVHNVSLEARKSKLTCIIGPNGAGKSTIIKTIYGFLRPRTGQVYHNNQEITGLRPYHMLMRGITYIPQARSIFPFLSVYENLRMGTWLFRHDKERVSSSIERVCDMFPVLRGKVQHQCGFPKWGATEDVGDRTISHFRSRNNSLG